MITYLGDANHHVLDEGFESLDGTSLFVTTVPHLDSDSEATEFLKGDLHYSDVDSSVAEVFGDGTSWSRNSNLSCFDGNFNYRIKQKTGLRRLKLGDKRTV